MRAVVQRVKGARLSVDGELRAEIAGGFVVLLGVAQADTKEDAIYLAEKISYLRVFPDTEGKMNLSLRDVGGAVLAVSQFTLLGDCRRGRRPNFQDAAAPPVAEMLFNEFVVAMRRHIHPVETGVFGAMMDIELINSGPVTIMLDSARAF